jgi:ABC-type nickel/cobalt efflux system permease component RcnA
MALIVVVGVVAVAPAAGAHPLGNFTSNAYAGLRIQPDQVLVDYVVDLAEIPAFREINRIDADGDDELSETERNRYRTGECERLATGLDLTVAGQSVALAPESSRLTFPPGTAGLDTLRLECDLVGPTAAIGSGTTVELTDGNFDGRVGWREITAVGDRTTVTESDVPEETSSDRLVEYPEEELTSPLVQRSAIVTVQPGGPAAPDPREDPATPGPLRAFDSFTSLVSRQTLTIPFAAFAMGVAFMLGTFHALAPGHGKTVIAAYMVSERGSRRQALLLGWTVAVTHTGGVFALGLVVSNSSIAPESLYPYLGALSGVLVIAIGAALLIRALRFRRTFGHFALGGHHHHGGFGHHHDHGHDHGGHDHDHGAQGNGHDHDTVADHDADALRADLAEHAPGPLAAGVSHATTVIDAAPLHDHDTLPNPHPTRVDGHDHDVVTHEHGHDHAATHQDGHSHDHDHLAFDDRAPTEDHRRPLQPIRRRNLMAMGFAGGLVPSPSALLVLLGAITLGRAWFGFLLIVMYGLGMAATLVTAGFLLERVRARIDRRMAQRSNPRLVRLAAALPLITATLVLAGGLVIAIRALTAA